MEGVRCRGLGSARRDAAADGLRPIVHTGAGLPLSLCPSARGPGPQAGPSLADVRSPHRVGRLNGRGGECANIAAFGERLLESGRIRYFAHVESIHGSYGGWGGPEIGAVLGAFWVDDFGGTASGHPNFDNKLVHEIEHAMGRGHIDAEGSDTPNSASCSGF